ncbi:conserved Plasmodium protein, unknown function [Plasmodium knowlesi strain H]|uniref:Protein Mpv17 n=3 Tax=Plasmodium knowlesi TaxID=5850 RepID=A0A5K1UHZ1_PLAKH|nr:protein Mpv17, putative [Plasmodium knowlesi strain H]OTN67147.1 Uncharacterized protein PKNOH_S07469700 [Plasmodium knowlesi]CAA9988821.1 protein Mpv17, putative [Plasmodium knowlesi strain H]SBO21828.1 conserved Plasmodium protein, unknown function [Plasmodium knowlesi strain H]SBO22199.1 conserved Plasmodium protein, unknown function [Plasmodium knowlesi strain H]VVS78295.1 protein Mpv17, putative [Plasmodium knowlesi strain H]|eukprot:XP_002259800.1 hypothetical protein, conserved in Plasmodium species [Plasmodium knowlesi strain H]
MLINAYMDIKRKHINFVFKNVNSSVKDYNFKRPYFAERCPLSKFSNHEGVKVKSSNLPLSAKMQLSQFKTPKLRRCEFEKASEKIIHTINSYLKGDTIIRANRIDNRNYAHVVMRNGTDRAGVNPRKFTTGTATTQGHLITKENSSSFISLREKNRYFQIEVRKGMHTGGNQNNGKSCEKTDSFSSTTNQTTVEKSGESAKPNAHFPHHNKNSDVANAKNRNNTMDLSTSEKADNIHSSAKNGKLPKGILSRSTSRMSQIMNNLFEKHLLLMNSLIASTLYFIADIACQMMELHKKDNEYDFSRTIRMATIGLTLEGPIMTWWYGKILANFIKSKPNTFLYKSFIPTLFDNFIFGPIHLTIFFFYNGMLKNQKKSEIIDKIVNTGMKVFFISLMTWTPLTLINFVFVPRIYQATVVFFADFFWVIFLSWCANKS